MAEQQKLGPNVTYTNPDHDAKLVTIAGVLLKEGESVNLEERLGAAQAAPIFKKLAGSRHFKVDGGQDWSQQKPPTSQPGQTGPAFAQLEEARLRKTEGDEAADKYVASLGPDGQPKEQAEAQTAEANYQGPAEPQLERPASRRKE